MTGHVVAPMRMVWADLGSFHFSSATSTISLRTSSMAAQLLSQRRQGVFMRRWNAGPFHFGLEDFLLAGDFTPQVYEPNED